MIFCKLKIHLNKAQNNYQLNKIINQIIDGTYYFPLPCVYKILSENLNIKNCIKLIIQYNY